MALKILVDRTLRAIKYLKEEALQLEEDLSDALEKVKPEYKPSAKNLIHYVALRRHDMRELQADLRLLGLSSLGGIEPHVMASLNAVLMTLYNLVHQPVKPQDIHYHPIDHFVGNNLLEEHAVTVLGPPPRKRAVRVMVTMPSEAADDPTLIRDLLAKGMDLMRVNCAHDNPEVWTRMLHNLRQAEEELDKTCRVAFDLAGPKLRTGPITPGPEVVRWRPTRNQLGQVITPATVIFTTDPPPTDEAAEARPASAETILPIGGTLLPIVQIGDVIQLEDARGRRRRLTVTETTAISCTCVSDRTGYVVSAMPLTVYRNDEAMGEDHLGQLPSLPQRLRLATGDTLIITSDAELGQPAQLDETGQVIQPAQIGCTLPEVFRDVQVGHRIFLDDGKFVGYVREKVDDRFRVELVRVAGGAAQLGVEKGINLPDTVLDLPALTAKDLEDLKFVVNHGDLVSLSFVQRQEDIEQLVAEIKGHRARALGIILKIEGLTAFNNLPRLLLTALQNPPVAVMVARGDLGVEVGFERLAEVQEEILWLCEAAHVPVIWATQVLESLAKRGVPSRAEVTDASMAGRAECVMLNKGPYINTALEFLCDILIRMQTHRTKKRSSLRKLNVSKNF
ncbi:MAG: pyruvate kinase [Anaerolineae bacterium]|nr:pyruvate kinase [Anaerolineae bacterium]